MQHHFDNKLETMVLDPKIDLIEVALSLKIRTMEGYIYTYLTTITPAKENGANRNRQDVLSDCRETADAFWSTFNTTLEDQQFIALYTEKMFINKNNIKEVWVEVHTNYNCEIKPR